MEATEITVHMHLEPFDGDHCWWADTEQVAGFSALAPTLGELRQRIRAALDETVGVDQYMITEHLVGARTVTEDGDATITADPREPVPA